MEVTECKVSHEKVRKFFEKSYSSLHSRVMFVKGITRMCKFGYIAQNAIFHNWFHKYTHFL